MRAWIRSSVNRPLSLLCELTYRCNLQCPYCYNPLKVEPGQNELNAEEWEAVLSQAAELGIVQAHFSGGEPTLRADLSKLVATASRLGLYTNLITQGTFLSEDLQEQLLAAGLAHIQISIQAPDVTLADHIAGAHVHYRKLEVLRRLSDANVAVTLNCVLHRHNHDSIEDVINFAEEMAIRRLELANVQFYGWALLNRASLMPTRAQVSRGEKVVARERKRLRGKMEITYVAPDYYEQYPKPCMNGWGTSFVTVTPFGRVLPCPAAGAISTLRFESVRETSLRSIWESSEAFNAYRGTAWMPLPCRSCERKEVDWGGCRCQAYQLTGNAGATDPACVLSFDHQLVEQFRDAGEKLPFVPRVLRRSMIGAE